MNRWTSFAVVVATMLAGTTRADLISPSADGNVRNGVTVETSSFLVFANLNPVNDDRGMFEFALGSIPTGSTILSATLRLNVVQGGGTVGSIGTYELYDYVGDGVITASDFGNVQSLLQPFTHTVGVFGPRTFDVTASVQDRVSDGNAFAGFLFRAVSQDTLIGFASSEHSTVSARPVLDVQFTSSTIIPEPASLVLCGIGMLGLVGHAWRRRRRACP